MSIYVSTNMTKERLGGWSFVKQYSDGVTCKWGNSKVQTKVTDMDLLGVFKACEFAEEDSCDIYTYSSYVYDGIHKYCEKWESNNWTTKNDKPIKSKELWEYIYKYKDIIHLKPNKNEICQSLATDASNNSVLNFLLI